MQSTKDRKKAEAERELFRKFADVMSWPNGSDQILSSEPPQPDILFLGLSSPIAFELAEICASDVAEQLAKLVKTGGVSGIWTSDPTEEILLSKLGKNYACDHPIELLCYMKGRVVSPDSQVEEQIATTLGACSKNGFRRIWYFGERKIFEFSPSGQLLNTTQRNGVGGG